MTHIKVTTMLLRISLRVIYLSVCLIVALSIVNGAMAGTKCQSRASSYSGSGCSQDP